MAARVGAAAGSVFVGRAEELGRVREVLDAAAAGRFSALLVSGDAGIGKTRLVERACGELVVGGAPPAVVVTATCLPLTSTTVPGLPLLRALRQLPRELEAPRLTTDGSGPSAPEVLDDWLDRTCRTRPVVLVVDDLQWADGATLDVLMYVLAAPRDRRLAVLMTLRRGEVGASAGLERWLADVRRMPVLTELRLGPLDRSETREQLRALLGSAPHESLVTEVHARAGGNPYLGRLIVEDLPPDARHLPAGLPEDLRSAVTRPWHHLSLPARALVLTVALGGEVAVGSALSRAVDIAGTPPSDTVVLLREAVDAGILDVTGDGGHWFHHPLQAEVLEVRLTGAERRLLHAAFARACEDDLPRLEGEPTSALLTAVAAVAAHHERADHHLDAYRWGQRAADLAERLGDHRAALEHLRRLLVLHEAATAAAGADLGARAPLLDRLRRTAAGLGDHEAEHAAVEALLAEVSQDREPLLVAELLVRREHLRFSTGRGFLRIEPVRHAVDVSRSWPRSWQHAYALAELAHASLWADAADGSELARAALERAEATGDVRALAYACAAASMAATFANTSGGTELGARGAEAAATAEDWWAFVHASLWEANGSGPWSADWAALVRGRRRQLEAAGAPHPYIAWLSADEAGALLNAGNWRGCADRLRVALGSDPGAGPDATTRLTAARLAVLQGRLSEAADHLARAEELFAETTGFLAFEFDAVRAMVRLGVGDPEGAFEAALAGATSPGVPPTLCEWLCPLAARALADLAVAAREQGSPPTPALDRLDALVERFPRVIADSAVVSPANQARLEGLDALYAAEVARARRSPDVAELWEEAATLLDGTHPWDAVYASWRAADAALGDRARPRRAGAALLRRAHALAVELGAEPVLREVEALGRSTRVSLEAVGTTPLTGPTAASGAPGDGLGRLTDREREVLSHVVAGRTYGEIARALFVSEKTVSSHLSNLLRKTGAANRVELATMARHAAERQRREATTALATSEPPLPPSAG